MLVSRVPENMQFYQHESSIEVVRARLSSHTLLIMVIAIGWNGFLVNQYFNVSENTHSIEN